MINPKLKQIARELDDFLDETDNLSDETVELLQNCIDALRSIKSEQSTTKILSNVRILKINRKGGKVHVKYRFEYAPNGKEYTFISDTKEIDALGIAEDGLYHVDTKKDNTGWHWISVEDLS